MNEKIIIWGAGDNCQRALNRCPGIRKHIEAIVDNDPLKWGTFLFDFRILPVQEIDKHPNATILISLKSDDAYREIIDFIDRKKLHLKYERLDEYIYKNECEMPADMNVSRSEIIELMPLDAVEERLQDEESKKIFWGRIQAAKRNNQGFFYKTLLKLKRENGKLSIRETYQNRVEDDKLSIINKYLKKEIDHKAHPLVLVGIEPESYGMLKYVDIQPDAFLKRDVDQEKYGLKYKEITIADCLEGYKEAFFLSGAHWDGPIKKQLLDVGIPSKNFLKRHTCWKSQYFDEDFLIPQKDGVFIDAGALNLNNSFDYIQWSEGNFERIYAFEPGKKEYDDCLDRLNSIDADIKNRVELYNAAVGAEDGVIEVVDNTRNKISTPCRSIDSVLAGKKATYIKMDIEGEELNALKGARQTIRKWKPLLAICVYHKPEDIWQLPLYILSLVPEYKIYIRHYSTCLAETVMYCL